MPGSVLVTGAAGFIGRAVCAHFADKGWRIVAGVRRDPDPVIRQADRYARVALPDDLDEDAAAQADACVHLGWDLRARSLAQSRRVNVEGTRRLLEAFSPAAGRPFLFVSSCSAFEGAASVYGRTKLEAEAVAREAGGCVARPGLVIGHGGLYGRMARFVLRRGLAPVVDGGEQRLQAISVPDLVEGLLRTLEDNPREPMVLASDEPTTLRELLAETARAAGRPEPKFPSMPSGAALRLLALAEAVGLRLPATKDNLAGLLAEPWQDPEASLEALGLGVDPPLEAVRDLFRDP